MRGQGYNSDGEIMSSMFVEHEPVDFDCGPEPSLTRQEFAAECDINNIMAQYQKTGVITHVADADPVYMDIGDVPDLQEAIEIVRRGETAFMTLPAQVRKEFDNDPVKFINFCSDEANVPRLREWGLAEPLPPEPPVTRVEVINPEPVPAK